MLYWRKVPNWLQSLFPHIVWRVSGSSKKVYLTFDDGPTPNLTPFIVNLLHQYQAKATFFCIGKQVQQFPQQFELIKNAGHKIGNHTFNHPKGWKTNTNTYLADVKQFEEIYPSNLFRPPYGQLTIKQYLTLKKQYKIVLWDIMNGDFLDDTSSKDCYNNIVNNVQAGSVIVMHDKERIAKKVEIYLPKVLSYLSNEGYEFGVL